MTTPISTVGAKPASMRSRPAARETIKRLTRPGDVDSRWWYWPAATLATFGLWVVAVAWVAVAITVGEFGDWNPLVRALDVSLVAFAVPFLALTLVFPFATYADASAVLAAGGDWHPARSRLTVGAAVGPLVALGVVLYGLATGSPAWVPLQGIVVGFLLTVPVAGYYLYRRHTHLGVP